MALWHPQGTGLNGTLKPLKADVWGLTSRNFQVRSTPGNCRGQTICFPQFISPFRTSPRPPRLGCAPREPSPHARAEVSREDGICSGPKQTPICPAPCEIFSWAVTGAHSEALTFGEAVTPPRRPGKTSGRSNADSSVSWRRGWRAKRVGGRAKRPSRAAGAGTGRPRGTRIWSA